MKKIVHQIQNVIVQKVALVNDIMFVLTCTACSYKNVAQELMSQMYQKLAFCHTSQTLW